MIRNIEPRAALFAAVSTMALCVGTVAHGEQAAQAPAVPPAAAAPAVDGSPSTDIVVTGYSASLRSALNAKRLSNLPIESITPEDVGKLPDQNVAESLQRLPGIQINRTGGRGTAVLIDGLRQNLTTLNGDIFLTGKEFYVSGEAAGGGNGGNSQYNSLEGIPSEEIGGIDVYKNPQASITEGGLGGTINLKTRDPLTQSEGFSLGGNARASTGQRDGSWTPNGTLVASYKFKRPLCDYSQRLVRFREYAHARVSEPEPQPVADHRFGDRTLCRAAAARRPDAPRQKLHRAAARLFHRPL